MTRWRVFRHPDDPSVWCAEPVIRKGILMRQYFGTWAAAYRYAAIRAAGFSSSYQYDMWRAGFPVGRGGKREIHSPGR